VFFASARAEARQLDEHFAATKTLRGPLHGVPVSLKDQSALPSSSAQPSVFDFTSPSRCCRNRFYDWIHHLDQPAREGGCSGVRYSSDATTALL